MGSYSKHSKAWVPNKVLVLRFYPGTSYLGSSFSPWISYSKVLFRIRSDTAHCSPHCPCTLPTHDDERRSTSLRCKWSNSIQYILTQTFTLVVNDELIWHSSQQRVKGLAPNKTNLLCARFSLPLRSCIRHACALVALNIERLTFLKSG